VRDGRVYASEREKGRIGKERNEREWWSSKPGLGNSLASLLLYSVPPFYRVVLVLSETMSCTVLGFLH
jgi:hypothetical protein